MGVVAGDRCPAAVPERDDPESDVRERGDRPGCTPDRNGRGSVQDHEGTIRDTVEVQGLYI